MNILLTGITGFIGSLAAKHFSEVGHRVHALVRNTNIATHADSLIQLSDDPAQSVKTAIKSHAIDGVVHLAGTINGTSESMHAGNSVLTQSIIEGLADTPDVSLIFISSVSATMPNTQYGKEKFRCEQAIEKSKLNRWTILRPSLVYGPGDSKNVTSLLRMVERYPIIPVVGRHTVKLQPMYVDDLLLMIEHALTLVGTQNLVVSGPVQIPLWDMLEIIESATGKKCYKIPISLPLLRNLVKLVNLLLPFLKLPVQQLETLDKQPYWDGNKAANLFNVQPRDFKTGIHSMIAAQNRRS